MFPLDVVLFPLGVLPLHVFEPRYLKMMEETLATDREFGVVLIERGSALGGGDSRFTVGTAAVVARTSPIDDQRLAIVAVGRRRVLIEEWLPEDPYPAAIVVDIPDESPRDDVLALIDAAHNERRRLLALASELGAEVGQLDLDLPSDPIRATWFLCSAAPIAQLDQQRLLEMAGAADRLEALVIALRNQAALLEAQLAAG